MDNDMLIRDIFPELGDSIEELPLLQAIDRVRRLTRLEGQMTAIGDGLVDLHGFRRLPPSLAALRWQCGQVDLEASVELGGILITGLNVRPNNRRQGIATYIINAVCLVADREQATLYAYVQPYKMIGGECFNLSDDNCRNCMNKTQLGVFLESHGFSRVKDNHYWRTPK